MNCILPPYLLARLEKQKNVKFLPDNLSDKFRHKRSLSRQRLKPGTVEGQGLRFVYDAHNTDTQRLFLVREEDQVPCGDADADKAYQLAGTVRQYFLNELQWNSVDGKGMNLVSNVHLGRGYNNAFWDGDEMSFGDGDGTYFLAFARAIDVTAHEMMHGVIQNTAGLLYDGQPGALNEHFADVFGTVVKQYHKKQDEKSADWLLGDEIMGPELSGRAIRSMKDPGDAAIPLDPQPAHMKDYYSGTEDNHGVHINSGIPNQAFYRVAMQSGTFAAAHLWFESLKKLKATSRFADLYDALAGSLPVLVSNGILRPSAYQVVESAFHETGILEKKSAGTQFYPAYTFAPGT